MVAPTTTNSCPAALSGFRPDPHGRRYSPSSTQRRRTIAPYSLRQSFRARDWSLARWALGTHLHALSTSNCEPVRHDVAAPLGRAARGCRRTCSSTNRKQPAVLRPVPSIIQTSAHCRPQSPCFHGRAETHEPHGLNRNRPTHVQNVRTP